MAHIKAAEPVFTGARGDAAGLETGFDGGEGASLRTSIENVGTLRARVGYAMNKVLCFVSGGLAVGDAEAVYDSDGSPSTKKVETPVGWVAGGGFRGGLTYGSTDEFGYHVVENRLSIYDLWATVQRQLGIDHESLTYLFGGRHFRLSDVEGHVVKDLIS